MFMVSDKASLELKKVMESEANKGKNLILYFIGAGCSGPSLGMALDDSTDGLVELNSNQINAYIEPKLKEYLDQIGEIKVDYITNEHGEGYKISVGDSDCGAGGCAGCAGHHE